MESIDCLVIGAGVVGLAVARALARAGREVVVVEAENAIGTGTSSRNSEVIHAGIYYPTGLLKTRLCVEGKAMLYAFCRDYGVPHRRCGKLVVAADDSEVAKLAALETQAKANGVDDLVWLTGEEGALSSRRSRWSAPCFRRRRESSTVTPLCWRCGATRRHTAQWLRSGPHSSAAAPSVAAWK